MNRKLMNAIKKWNNPNSIFVSSYTVMYGHRRGRKPHFISQSTDDGLKVNIENDNFTVDKFEYDDFNDKSEKEVNDFINYVNNEVKTMKTICDDVTKTINKNIIDLMIKENPNLFNKKFKKK